MKRVLFAPAVFVLGIVGFGFAMNSHSSVPGGELRASKKVLMISIDSLRPEFYSGKAFPTPTLKKLAQSGARAQGVIPVFPTVTYPNHTALVTGAYSGKHGVLSNSVFDWSTGKDKAWYWEASLMKVPPIWEELKKVNKTTASVRWPVTVGAKLKWLVPEIFPVKGFYEGTDWELTQKHSTPELMDELIKELGKKGFEDWKEADVWAAKATAHIVKTHKPDLTLFHIVEVDHAQHSVGRDGKEVKEALKFADDLIAGILKDVDMNQTCVMIVGDHGFFNYTDKVRLNRLFYDEGWIEVEENAQGKERLKSWKVISHKSGGQAVIYTKNKKLDSKVMKVLKDNQKLGYRLIDRRELNKLGAYPNAMAAIEANEGVSLTRGFTGEAFKKGEKTKGTHGYSPKHKKLHTGFIASGCGIKPQDLGTIRMIDVAPTVARILGTTMPKADGRPIRLLK